MTCKFNQFTKNMGQKQIYFVVFVIVRCYKGGDMKRFGIAHPLILSFYSKELYQDVGQKWTGVGFIYLLFLLSLCWIPIGILGQTGIDRFVDERGAAFTGEIPKITITQGEVFVDAKLPYYIKDTVRGKTVAILDPSGAVQSLDNTDAIILLTRTKVIYRNSPTETRMYDLSKVNNFTMTRDDVRRWLGIGKKWLMVIVFPFLLVFSFLYRILQALLYGWIGMFFAKNSGVTLDYKAAVRLAVIAVTPVLTLDTAFDMAHVKIPYWSLICLGITMSYLYFGVKANRETVA